MYFFFFQTGCQQMAKTISMLNLSAHKDGGIWHTIKYNPKLYPTRLLLNKDQWPLLQEFKNQKIKKTLGFGSLYCLPPVIIVSSPNSSLFLAMDRFTGSSIPDTVLLLYISIWETQAFMQWI